MVLRAVEAHRAADPQADIPEYVVTVHSEGYCVFRFSLSQDARLQPFKAAVEALLRQHGLAVLPGVDAGGSTLDGAPLCTPAMTYA